jgi:hypothetical protein
LGSISQPGKIWAIVSYVGFFVGIPLCIIPLVLRNDSYALYHARHATAVYLGTLLLGVTVAVIGVPLNFCTFGMAGPVIGPLGVLIVLWPVVHAVHGLIIVARGKWQEPIGAFGLGDRMFGGIDVD